MLQEMAHGDYMPHGHCYFWEPDLVWLHLIADLGVFLSYATIPAFLAVLIRRRGDIAFRGVAWLFVAFILLCGFTHLMGAVTIWHPFYRFEGFLKLATAMVSGATAIVLFKALPLALSIPSPSRLQKEVEDRRRVQETLEETLARNEALFDALPDQVFELNSQRNCVRYTSGVVSPIAHSQDVLGMDFSELIGQAEGDADTVNDAIIAATNTGDVQRVELSLRDAKGELIETDLRIAPEGHGGWVVVMRDITEERRLLQGLQASREVLEQFVYIASHDLRSPLRAVNQLAEWLEEDLGPALKGEHRSHLDELRKRVRRMDTMLSGLLEFSRAGRPDDNTTDVDLQEVLDSIVAHELSAERKDTRRFDVVTDRPLPVIHTVRAPIERVIANLVINAMAHHDKNEGTICVGVDTSASHHILLTVEDDGPGIAARYHDKVFELFQTLVPKDRKESSGMGLAIVRRLVISLGGSIHIESPISNGRGSRFVVMWPKRVHQSIWPGASED